MTKWNVNLAFSASKFVGGVEAETKEEAIEKAMMEHGYVSICHKCSDEIEVGDVIEDDCSAEMDDDA